MVWRWVKVVTYMKQLERYGRFLIIKLWFTAKKHNDVQVSNGVNVYEAIKVWKVSDNKKSYDTASDQAIAYHPLHKQTAKVTFFYSMGNQKKTASFFR